MSNKEDQVIQAAPVEQTQHAIYVAEGTGKTAQNEGAKAKVVHNVSADGSFFNLVFAQRSISKKLTLFALPFLGRTIRGYPRVADPPMELCIHPALL
jgi:hypothetical protein